MRPLRRLGGAQYRRLLVAHAPVPWRDEGALPHPGFCLTRGSFVGIIVVGDTGVGQRPAAPHQPFLDVLAADLAARDRVAAPVDRTGMADPVLALGIFGELVARGDAAGPALTIGVEAELVG